MRDDGGLLYGLGATLTDRGGADDAAGADERGGSAERIVALGSFSSPIERWAAQARHRS